MSFLETYDNKNEATMARDDHLSRGVHAVLFTVPGVEVRQFSGSSYVEIFKDPPKKNWIVAVERD